MTVYDLARGLHILAVIAWMAGLLFLPRLYAYDAEQAAKPEPLRGEMQALLRTWQTRLLRIILNPAMILAWGFGLWLIHLDTVARGAAFLLEPWMLTKLLEFCCSAAGTAFWPGSAGRLRRDRPDIPAASGA